MPLTPSHTVNHGRRYRYYVEQSGSKPAGKSGWGFEDEQRQGDDDPRSWCLPAHQIEQFVLQRLGGLLKDRAGVREALPIASLSTDAVSAALDCASALARECHSAAPKRQAVIVQKLVHRIAIAADKVPIEMRREGLSTQFITGSGGASETAEETSEPICIDVPVKFRRRGVETKLVVGGKQVAAQSPDPNLVKLLARAHAWFDMFVTGEAQTLDEIARMEGLDRSYVSRVTCLAFLTPQETRYILTEVLPAKIMVESLIGLGPQLPLLWRDQIVCRSA